MKRVLVLDGYNLIYRARYSGMYKGEYSTVFNFFRGLRPLIEKFSPDLCYFVLEGKPVRRLLADPEYKGQRTYHNKDNFQEQKKIIINTLSEFFPINIARHPGYECDDVINYLANCMHKNDNTVIVSSDTDFIQSINENTGLYNPVSKKFLNETEYDYVNWKSLVGDKSDNIIGFKGIGDKRAKLLLSDKEKLDDFLSKENNKEAFEKNKFMIKFHDLEKEKNNIEIFFQSSYNWIELKNKFSEMSFNSIVQKEKTWEKYINTFKTLERKNHYDYWNACITKHSI